VNSSTFTPQNLFDSHLDGRITFNNINKGPLLQTNQENSSKTNKLKKIITNSIIESMPFVDKRKYSTNTSVNFNKPLDNFFDFNSNNSIQNSTINRNLNAGFRTPNSLHHKQAINPLFT
jgi:hypothetical protein